MSVEPTPEAPAEEDAAATEPDAAPSDAQPDVEPTIDTGDTGDTGDVPGAENDEATTGVGDEDATAVPEGDPETALDGSDSVAAQPDDAQRDVNGDEAAPGEADGTEPGTADDQSDAPLADAGDTKENASDPKSGDAGDDAGDAGYAGDAGDAEEDEDDEDDDEDDDADNDDTVDAEKDAQAGDGGDVDDDEGDVVSDSELDFSTPASSRPSTARDASVRFDSHAIEGFDDDFLSGDDESSEDDLRVEGLQHLKLADDDAFEINLLDEVNAVVASRTLERDSLLAETAALEARIATALARLRGDKAGRSKGNQNEDEAKEDEGEFRAALVRWKEMSEHQSMATLNFGNETTELELKLREKTQKADEARISFQQKIEETGKHSVSEKTGKAISKTGFSRRVEEETKAEALLSKARLHFVELTRTRLNLEKKIKQKEHLAEGLKLIDFEQLKMETTALKEKFMERAVEYQKIKTKTSDLIQILTHCKEKLQFTNLENEELVKEMARVDKASKVKGDVMQRLKDEILQLKKENESMQSEAATITDSILLDDYADQKSHIRKYRDRLDEISSELNELTLVSTVKPGFISSVKKKDVVPRATGTAQHLSL